MKKIILLFSLLLMNMNPAQAVLRVEVTKGAEGAAPIAIIPFEHKGASISSLPDVAALIAADLKRSGRFAPVEEDKLVARPQSLEMVNYKLWRIASIDHLVIGQGKWISLKERGLGFS